MTKQTWIFDDDKEKKSKKKTDTSRLNECNAITTESSNTSMYTVGEWIKSVRERKKFIENAKNAILSVNRWKAFRTWLMQ